MSSSPRLFSSVHFFNFTNTYPTPGILLSATQRPVHLILATLFELGTVMSSYFTNEETGAQKAFVNRPRLQFADSGGKI